MRPNFKDTSYYSFKHYKGNLKTVLFYFSLNEIKYSVSSRYYNYCNGLMKLEGFIA